MMCRKNDVGDNEQWASGAMRAFSSWSQLIGRAHTVWLERPEKPATGSNVYGFNKLRKNNKSGHWVCCKRVFGYQKHIHAHTPHSINIDIYLTICRSICGGRPHNIRLFIRRPVYWERRFAHDARGCKQFLQRVFYVTFGKRQSP